MSMLPTRIAVTTDFSEESRKSFGAAASLARKFSAELLLVHLAQMPPVVLSPWPEVGPYLVPDDVFDAVEKRLAELARDDSSFGGLSVRPLVVRGESVDVLVEALANEQVELLITATHGYSGVKRFLLGSFAERALRVARCPVLVHHGESSTEFAPQRIYIAHDFSPAGKLPLAAAREWARAFRARVQLHFVVEQSASLYDYSANMQGCFKDYLERVREQGLERFRRLIREEWKDVEAEACATVGQAAEEVLRVAREFEADLMILGTHRRSTLERFFLGSVAQKVTARAPVSVLTLRG